MMKIPTRSLFYTLLLVLGATICLVAPLVHIDMPVDTSEVVEFKKSQAISLSVVDYQIKENRSLYDDGAISAEAYIKNNDNLLIQRSNLKKQNKKELQSFVDGQRLFGWKSPRKFWIAFGIRLPYLLFAIAISVVIKLWEPTNKLLRKSLIYVQILFYSSAAYQLIWVFWALDSDYPPKTYWMFFVFISIILGISSTFSFRWYNGKLNRLESLTRKHLRFIYKDAQQMGFIKKEKLTDWDQTKTKIVDHAIQNE